MPVQPAVSAAEVASSITWRGVRLVRVISRIDCWAKIGAMPAPAWRMATTSPAVARPRRSPKPKVGARPRGRGAVGAAGVGWGIFSPQSEASGDHTERGERCEAAREAMHEAHGNRFASDGNPHPNPPPEYQGSE